MAVPPPRNDPTRPRGRTSREGVRRYAPDRSGRTGRGVGSAINELPRRVATGSNGVLLRDKRGFSLAKDDTQDDTQGDGNHFRQRARAALEELIAATSDAAAGGAGGPSLEDIIAPYVQAESSSRWTLR